MAWQYRGQNALTYGSQGAAIGGTLASIIPGVGTGVGAGIGAGIGGLIGLLSPTEQQELAERLRRGEIDPQQEAAIAEALGRRFHAMQIRYGTSLARRGLTDSTIAARLQAGLMEQEGDALAEALAGVSQQNKQIGMDMVSQQAQARAGAIGQATSVLGNLYLADRQAKYNAEYLDAVRGDLGKGTTTTTPQKTTTPAKPSRPIGSSNPGLTQGHARKKAGAVSVPPVKKHPGWTWGKPSRTVPQQRQGAHDPLAGGSSMRNRSFSAGSGY